MYSKERAQQITKNDVRYIPAGIQDNVQLKSARFDKSPQGNSFMEIVFEKNGATLPQTEWQPTKFGNMTEEDLQKKEDTQFSRILQILRCFYNDDELVFNCNTFDEWAKEVVDYLNKADKSKLLRVKVVYNNKGYTALPSYAKYTFIEPMELPEGQLSAITEIGIDKFTKPVIADTETIVPNLKDTITATADTNINDLPF